MKKVIHGVCGENRRAGGHLGGRAGPDPVLVGVSGLLTGQHVQYGVQWQKGAELALDEANGAGGTGGRQLKLQFEDSQSDPKQSVAIARKFVADPAIVVELGDLSSAASMAASPSGTAARPRQTEDAGVDGLLSGAWIDHTVNGLIVMDEPTMGLSARCCQATRQTAPLATRGIAPLERRGLER
ncbi:ABC transporter substrate-binding protein, partial [Azospirillum argentinense]